VVRPTQRTHFLPQHRPKLRLGRCRESDVSRVRRALRTYFLPSGRTKMRLGRGGEIDVVREHLALWTHFLPPGRSKMGLGDFEKAMFQGFAGPANSLSAFWKAQIANRTTTRERCSRCRLALRTHYLLSGRPKMRLGWGRESYVWSFPRTLRTNFLPLAGQNATRMRSWKHCFKGWPDPSNSFAVVSPT
jgi:hypothetical protein